MNEPTLPLTFAAILAQIGAPTTIIEPWPGFRVDIAEREHEQMMAAIRADILYGGPIVLDEAACLRLSIADSYEPHSPVWCKNTPLMLSFRGDRVWLFQQHCDQRRRYRRRTGWRTL